MLSIVVLTGRKNIKPAPEGFVFLGDERFSNLEHVLESEFGFNLIISLFSVVRIFEYFDIDGWLLASIISVFDGNFDRSFNLGGEKDVEVWGNGTVESACLIVLVLGLTLIFLHCGNLAIYSVLVSFLGSLAFFGIVVILTRKIGEIVEGVLVYGAEGLSSFDNFLGAHIGQERLLNLTILTEPIYTLNEPDRAIVY